MSVAVVGAGSFGSALASVLAANGQDVILYGRSAQIVREINETHTNVRYLPGVLLTRGIRATTDLTAVRGAETILLVVPSQALRAASRALAALEWAPQCVIHAVKGLEKGTGMRMSQVLQDEWTGLDPRSVVVLSGPSHAEELSRGLPTTLVASSVSRTTAEYAQDLLMNDRLRVYTNPDVSGVELGGSLKNIIALGCGISDGLNFGDNARAALMTRGLVEIARLGVSLGAAAHTFFGLTGAGDLIVTSTSRHSRNWQTGFRLGRGMSVAAAVADVGMTVEGVLTTHVAVQLARGRDISMPIAEAIASVLGGASPEAAVTELMTRTRTHEVEEYLQEAPTGWQED